ncbi:histone-lysine N-methyltransferase SETD1B-like isoform X13 [Eriocheir sinensis]|uniref:histone-lysine N-methyltransferase SETD1B-like isoform X13 n=1 Tax=Eriocheir sinensis TaxID=95602 RepID=UPI0021C94BE8|nr:histone-lysine N-methyltransferase SETD1B-like isoform X13 [Eriocheir sinensis]
MKTKVVNEMFPKARSKDIRRAVLGTCVVLAADGGASGGARPRKVTITLCRRRGCWRALSSRGVAVFAFPEASGPTSLTAPLDLEYLFRCSGKPDAEATQVKICVAYRRGATRKARVSLEEFLEALLDGGRPGSFFLYIYDDKVGLQLASQQFQGLPTTWPLEQKPGKGKMAMHTDGNTDAAYNEWKLYLEKVFAVEDDEENTDNDEDTHNEQKVYLEKVFAVEDDEENTDNDEDTYNEWKVYLEKVFAVEDHEEHTDNDEDTYNEWKDYLEKVFSVEDDVGDTDNDDGTHSEGKGLPNKLSAVEEDDFDEAAHEVRDACDVAAGEEEQVSDVPAAEEEPACDVPAAEEEQASDVAAAEQVQASDVPAAEQVEASDVPAAEEEQASDVAAAEQVQASDVPAAEQVQASDVPAAEEEQASDVAAAEQMQASDVPAAEEEQACDVAATEEEQAPDVAATQEEAPQHAEASRGGTSATDREVSPQGQAPAPVTVPAAPATASLAYRSLTVPQRFISRLAGPSDRQLEDLRRSHGVSIVRVRRTLHIKGERDAVLRCHRHMRDEIAEWRRREAAEAE